MTVKLVGVQERLVHRLVALVFCEGYEEGLHVNHIDGNRLNNRMDNLEWCTVRENIHDSMERGTHTTKEARKEAVKSRRRRLGQYTLDGKFIKEWESVATYGRETGRRSSSKIYCVCSGKREHAYGFKWKYLDGKPVQSALKVVRKDRITSEAITYPSILQANKSIGVNNTYLRNNVLPDKYIEYKGFLWRKA